MWSDQESYNIFGSWSDVLSECNVIRVVKMTVAGKDSIHKLASEKIFFKLSQDNVYACFREGAVPRSVIDFYSLTQENLKQADWPSIRSTDDKSHRGSRQRAWRRRDSFCSSRTFV